MGYRENALTRLGTLLFGIGVLVGGARAQEFPITAIEFFGQQGIDTERLTEAFPFRLGTPVSLADEDTERFKAAVAEATRRTIGADPTDVLLVCCGEGGVYVYVGLPGASSRAPAYYPPPTGDSRLPPALDEHMDGVDDLFKEAAQAGKFGEDISAGYSLAAEYPPLRAAQLKIREYALEYESEVFDVLRTSADAEQRAIAATVLGYGRQTEEQIAALVKASADPDGGVRDSAVRALGVRLRADNGLTRVISPDPFIEMLASTAWSDRNKASFVVEVLTRSRSPRILGALRARALPALLEMAEWPASHAATALLILGRVAGIEEGPLMDLARNGQRDVIIDAVGN